jgi:ribosomal protein S18 acetylase RimI-like enzyme
LARPGDLLGSAPSGPGPRWWGKAIGATAATLTPVACAWAVLMIYLAIVRGAGVIPLGIASFAAVILPGMLFVAAIACLDVTRARMAVMVVVAPLKPEDRPAWEELSRGYKAFYRTPTTDEQYEAAWRQLRDEGSGFCGLGAYLDDARGGESAGVLVGIAHYLFHPAMWYGDVCYLQDLFVAEAARGRGAARALIERVAEIASSRGADRLYWTTQEDNARARLLYDKVARFNGFIRYDYPLGR